MKFERDPVKSSTNKNKHGLSFEEAIEVFADPNAIEIYDEDHSREEERYKVIGLLKSKVVMVSLIFTECGDIIRVISARKADKEEKEAYGKKR